MNREIVQPLCILGRQLWGEIVWYHWERGWEGRGSVVVDRNCWEVKKEGSHVSPQWTPSTEPKEARGLSLPFDNDSEESLSLVLKHLHVFKHLYKQCLYTWMAVSKIKMYSLLPGQIIKSARSTRLLDMWVSTAVKVLGKVITCGSRVLVQVKVYSHVCI